MELTPAQYKEIEKLASVNYSVKQIAMYLDVDPRAFQKEFSNLLSKIRYHYDRGLLVTQAELDMANLKRAKDGNMTSIQQWKKDANSQKLDNLKKQVFFDEQHNEYEQLQALIERGETKNLPEKVVNFYEQIDFIRCLYNKYESKSFIINAVVTQFSKLSKYQATQLYYETLNFFNLDNQVKVEAWGNIYADRLDNMSRICYELNDFETARRFIMDAAELRGVGKDRPNQIPEELLDRRPIFQTMRPEDVGLPKVNRKEMAAWIDNLDITERQKNKTKADAMIEDVPFELMSENGED